MRYTLKGMREVIEVILMKDLIVPLLITIGMGIYAGLACWILALRRKIRDLERDQRARAKLRLAPKQDNWQQIQAVENHNKGLTSGICINHRCTEHLLGQDHEIRIRQRKMK